ncbi:hypothetical protein CR513_37755, partial [Mucuna pruriens]
MALKPELFSNGLCKKLLVSMDELRVRTSEYIQIELRARASEYIQMKEITKFRNHVKVLHLGTYSMS